MPTRELCDDIGTQIPPLGLEISSVSVCSVTGPAVSACIARVPSFSSPLWGSLWALSIQPAAREHMGTSSSSTPHYQAAAGASVFRTGTEFLENYPGGASQIWPVQSELSESPWLVCWLIIPFTIWMAPESLPRPLMCFVCFDLHSHPGMAVV